MSLPTLIALAAAAAALVLFGVVVYALARPDAARRRVLGLFRKPPAPPRTPGSGHYYKPYWS